MKKLEHKMIRNNNTVVNVNQKNRSAIFICNDRIVDRVVRNAALKKVSEFFENKIKSTIDKHYTILHEKEHGSSGKLVGHDVRKEPLDSLSGPYAYRKIKEKNLVQ